MCVVIFIARESHQKKHTDDLDLNCPSCLDLVTRSAHTNTGSFAIDRTATIDLSRHTGTLQKQCFVIDIWPDTTGFLLICTFVSRTRVY